MSDLSPLFDALPALNIAAAGAKVLTDAAGLAWPRATSGRKGLLALLLALVLTILWLTLQSPIWDVARGAEAGLTALFAWAAAVGATALQNARLVAGARAKQESPS